MKNTSYVKLPCLKRLEVENYSLFTTTWSYDLKNGLNLFIGTNGLGKTTTTNLIIYGLVGYNQNINVDYFKNRGEKLEGDFDSVVKLSFSVDTHDFEIHRFIEDDTIKYLSVDDLKYTREEIDNLDEIYEALLIKYTNISSLGDIVFLLQKFLIREEEGNYLIWDDKGGDQARLIRILINNSSFESEYAKLAKDYKDLDSKVRGNQDIRAQFVKKLNELEAEKAEELKKRDGYYQKTNILEQYRSHEREVNELIEVRDKNIENINYILNNIKGIDSELETISSDFEIKNEEITTLENKLFKHVYSDDKVLTAIHKLKHYNVCIYCNNKPKLEIVTRIVKKLEIENQCPVCDSHLESVHPDLNNDEVLADLESSQGKLVLFKSKIDDLEKNRRALKVDLDKLWDSQDKIEKNINVISIKLYDLKLQVSNLSKNPEEQITVFDTQIRALEKQILKFDQDIDPNKQKLEKVREKLLAKNDQQKKTITSFEVKLNEIFNKYTSKYFINGCSLVTVERKPKESNIPVTSYVPEFDGKKRVEIKTCSTSQRIFLEYLFRISLIELYSLKSSITPFMIMETSEGAFDLTNTTQLASSFNEFSKSNIPFILICNFSKPEFLKTLSLGIDHNKDRFLNYLEFGRLSEQHNKDLIKYNPIIKDLKLV